MKQEAIDKATARLEKANESLAKLNNCTNHKEFSSAWADFLLAFDGVFEMLKQGARENPKTRQWYGGKNNKEFKDPLIQYLLQARNSEHHGLEPVTELQPGYTTIGGKTTRTDNLSISMSFDEYQAAASQGPVVLQAAGENLVPVTDTRYGTTFNAPAKHLEQPLRDRSPRGVARLGLAYASGLIEEAKKLV